MYLDIHFIIINWKFYSFDPEVFLLLLGHRLPNLFVFVKEKLFKFLARHVLSQHFVF